MSVNEVVKEYGADRKYIVHDTYEEAYYELTREGIWFDAFDLNDENFDEDKAIEIKDFPEEKIIIIVVDTSSR
jgi:hypothetical protein